ncbi:uncharacterized protein BDR25DRAFT_353068 [Lindgomyces ingoldianus]|uniref:Uncharacterized protein n=1 Tax=Lindgomyces ingoldianus TaxID=673940 RepID=A0ACB6R0A6_9PLEO|nr:uncharacterized protein BDR25DRAFT_353068 [Lindgomyces ingoldianus]KAF2472744.1 hypothetical protein BDR25DRAFT_353068 [Lindgomyces ingoldianus]
MTILLGKGNRLMPLNTSADQVGSYYDAQALMIKRIIVWDGIYSTREALTNEITPLEIFSRSQKRRFHVLVVISAFIRTPMWLIKLTILIFIWSLDPHKLWASKVRRCCILAITAVGYLFFFATLPFECQSVGVEDIHARRFPNAAKCTMKAIVVSVVSDIVINCLILSIPWMIVRQLQLAFRQNVALFGLFSLFLVTIGFAITRATMIIVHQAHTVTIDVVWNII